MGETVEFPSNGSSGTGYLAVPESGSGPGVVVIQEWWGLNDHIKEVCDRYASEGFVALAPDDYLTGHDAVTGRGVGVTGFCMGGGLALWLATLRPDDVKAVVPYYGLIPWPAAQPDYSKLRARLQG